MRTMKCYFALFAALVAASPASSGVAFAAPLSYTNSIGMEFVPVPAGTFQMGCSPEVEEEKECGSWEVPRHEVRISKSFYLGKYEVTQAQWEALMGNNPSEFKGADRPVDSVTWEDVQKFIKKLNAQEGHQRYRLPTEAEWEYAARAGSAAAFCFGNDREQLRDYAWYEDNSGDETHAVGQKRPNAWGLYDMHGNVEEWVQDRLNDYDAEAAVPEEPVPGKPLRMFRGGSWNSTVWGCRSAQRDFFGPIFTDDFLGFRLASLLQNLINVIAINFKLLYSR